MIFSATYNSHGFAVFRMNFSAIRMDEFWRKMKKLGAPWSIQYQTTVVTSPREISLHFAWMDLKFKAKKNHFKIHPVPYAHYFIPVPFILVQACLACGALQAVQALHLLEPGQRRKWVQSKTPSWYCQGLTSIDQPHRIGFLRFEIAICSVNYLVLTEMEFDVQLNTSSFWLGISGTICFDRDIHQTIW